VTSDASPGHPTATEEDARTLLERQGAILRGHFRLTSGRHSNLYVQKARLLEHPESTMLVAREMASWYQDVQVVVATAVGAIALGFAVALAAGARSLFAERSDGRMTLRRGFEVAAGERTLVVEDIVTTGGSAHEVYEMVGRTGGERLGVAALVDRSAGSVAFPLRALVRVEADMWGAQECPLCRAGTPLDAPGSRFLGQG
jgi:orotate phosphoribosyltransferase